MGGGVNRHGSSTPPKKHLGGGIFKKPNFPLKNSFLAYFRFFGGCTPHSPTPTPPVDPCLGVNAQMYIHVCTFVHTFVFWVPSGPIHPLTYVARSVTRILSLNVSRTHHLV